MQSVMLWGAMSSAAVGGGWSTVFHQVQSQHCCLPGDQVMGPSVHKPYGNADFFFQQALVPANTAKTTSKCFATHVIICA